jgi:carboxymethylenebutenolidase
MVVGTMERAEPFTRTVGPSLGPTRRFSRRSVRRKSWWLVLAAGVALGVAMVPTAVRSAATYAEVFYSSGGLRIQAYLYKPEGDGPFPAVIYNHGSRTGRERQSAPFEHVGALLTGAGYTVLVSERRGYGRSDGPTWPEDVGKSRGRMIARLEEETDDVLAAVDYLRTQAFVDARRIGVMGWSFGGIVTMFAVSRSQAFAVAVNQAGGALTWNGNPDVRTALTAAAQKSTTPTLLQVAENDRTTDSITTVGEILKTRGVPHRVVIYPPFAASRQPQSFTTGAPGHLVFSERGLNVWAADVLEFLGQYLTRPGA